MKNVKQPELPNCAPQDLRFKHVSTVNEAGYELAVCGKCAGSGLTCSAKREVLEKGKITPQTQSASFTGHDLKKYVRQGWSVHSERCDTCKGAGLVLPAAEGR